MQYLNQLITDTAEIAVTQIGTNTKTGSYAITKSGSDFFDRWSSNVR